MKNKKNTTLLKSISAILCMALILFLFLEKSEEISPPQVHENLVPDKVNIIQEVKSKNDIPVTAVAPKKPEAQPHVVAPAPQKPTEATCSDPTQYSCVRKIFQPDVKSGEYVSYECVEIPADEKHDIQKFCMNVKVFSFNTRAAYSNCSTCKSEDIEPGGRYHFEEFSCVNEGFKAEISPSNEDPFPIKNEGKNLIETFTQTYQLCHSYPEKPIGAIAQGELKREMK